MKRRNPNNPVPLFTVTRATIALMSVPAQGASTYYWECDGSNPGFGTAQGTWAAPTVNTSTVGWSSSTGGTTAPLTGSTTTANGDTVNFGGTTSTTGLGAGTVTVNGTVNASTINFGAYSGAITLAPSSTGGTITLSGTTTINVNNSGRTDTISAVLGGSTGLTINGSGTLMLSGLNSIIGTATQTGVVIALAIGTNSSPTVSIDTIADYGTPCSLGSGPNGSVLLMGNNDATNAANTATLSYTGGAASSNRVFQIGPQGTGKNATAVINNDGSGGLTLTANPFNSQQLNIVPTRNLVLGGSYTGENEIRGAIQNHTGSGGILTVSMNGSGTWKLSGANTYTGPTTVTAGKLLINGSTAGGSAVTVSSSGTLGGTGTINGTVSVTAGGGIALGASGATLTLANSTAPTYNSSGSTYTTMKLAASTATLDKISASATTGNSVANVDLVIDTTGLTGDVSPTVIYQAGGAITGPFHSVTVVGNTAYTPTVDYSTSGQIGLSLAAATAYSNWLATYGVADTPDNSLKFGFGIVPSASLGSVAYTVGSPPTVTAGYPTAMLLGTTTADFKAVFSRPSTWATDGLAYTVQFSADLSAWADSTDIRPLVIDGTTISADGVDVVYAPYPGSIEIGGNVVKPTFFRVHTTP